MKSSTVPRRKFAGHDAPLVGVTSVADVDLPTHVRPIDMKCLVAVDLTRMEVIGDEGRRTFRLKAAFKPFATLTAAVATFAILEALNGRRKVSTTFRWCGELSLFAREVLEASRIKQIATITLGMYNWYASRKNPSQVKLLRSVLKFWCSLELPGISRDLHTFLRTSAAPRPRGTIEIQNAEPAERPFSIQEVRALLTDIEALYISGRFNPQDNLLWRLTTSEAMRPTQLSLLRVGDVRPQWHGEELISVRVDVPMVKQGATPAREYMQETKLSKPVSKAMLAHLRFIEQTNGAPLPAHYPLFCVCRDHWGALRVQCNPISIAAQFQRTRILIAQCRDQHEPGDFFNRRFKHTKLTHLATMGAPLKVLARAGYQTSDVSLRRYVNLTDESFEAYENVMADVHVGIKNAFVGVIVERGDETHPDEEHRIPDPSMEDDLGACGVEPCEALVCLGCYTCYKFQAFSDGPHEKVEEYFVAKRERAVAMNLPPATIARDDYQLAAVRDVVQQCREFKHSRET